MKDKRRSLLSKLALYLAAMIWGSSFFVVKNTVDELPTFLLLAIRFTLGSLLLSLIFARKIQKTDRKSVTCGAFLGLLLFGAYAIQTVGLTDTTPGKNAFLTAVYCVIVPFFYWVVDKRRPDRFHIIASFICVAGIGLVSLDGDLSVRWGDVLTLISGLFFAAHIVAISNLGKGRDAVVLTIVQFVTCALLSWVATLIFEEFPTQVSSTAIWSMLYLAVLPTSFALLLQNVGQQGTDPASASLILSLEAVFGVLFSVVFYGEQLSAKLIFGFLLIFVAIVISETKLAFLPSKRKARALSAGEKQAD